LWGRIGVCSAAADMAKKLEELRVYQRSSRDSLAISALLRLPPWRDQRKLSEQLGESSDSVPSNISEGFGRSRSDFRRFLEYSRGSANEVRTHLATALGRRCITAPTFRVMDRRDEITGRMLTRFIQYLRRSSKRHKPSNRRKRSRAINNQQPTTKN
jgi:four helix bundle protein